MLSTKTSFAIAKQPIDEVTIAQSELEQHLESQLAAGATQPSKGFRRGYGEHAAEIAKEIRELAATGSGAVWEIAVAIAEMRSRLNRKEWSVFVASMLEWAGNEAKKYLDIARAFEGFDFSALSGLEPFTLLKLRTKRYAPVVHRLREESVITPKRVQELIEELLPKPQKRQVVANYSDTLQQHITVEDGTFYYTLKEVNLSEKAGSWLEEKLKTQTIGQVLEQAAEWEKTVQEVQEFQGAISEMREVCINQEAEIEERDRTIAELKAKLADATLPSEVEHTENVETPSALSTFKDQFSTWEEVANYVEYDRTQLINIVKNWEAQKTQSLVNLLVEYLQTGIEVLDSVTWTPKKLLNRALLAFSYTVQKIGGGNNLVDEPEIIYFHNCSFVSLKSPGTKHEQWIFADRNNRLLSVFGRHEFDIEKS